jgi:hypothetical protein
MTLDACLRQPRFAIIAASARLDRDRKETTPFRTVCEKKLHPFALCRKSASCQLARYPIDNCPLKIAAQKLSLKAGISTSVFWRPSVPHAPQFDLFATGCWLAADCGWQRTMSQPPAQATAFLLIDPYASGGCEIGNITRRHECAPRMSMSQACQVSKLVSP